MDSFTKQPVKGRKAGGGIRIGEMERDALLAHGASFTIQERLNYSSDRSSALICTNCHSMFTTSFEKLLCGETERDLFEHDEIKPKRKICFNCDAQHDQIKEIDAPYIFKVNF